MFDFRSTHFPRAEHLGVCFKMASKMSIQFILNDPQMPPTPLILGLKYDSTPYGMEIVYDGKDCLDIHNATATQGDPFTLLNGLLAGSKLTQNPHLRSPYGPDFPYRHMDYPHDHGLLYRWGRPAAETSLTDAYLNGLTQQQLAFNHFHAHQLALAHDRFVAQNMGLLPNNYQKNIQHCVPAPSMMAPLGQNHFIDLIQTPRNLLNDSETPVQLAINNIQKVKRTQKSLKRNKASTTQKSAKGPAVPKDEKPILPGGYVIDYFTGQPRKMRMWENVRARFETYVRMPIEERPQGVHWEHGDSEMDFSEWEEANRSKERIRRARKLRMTRLKSNLGRGREDGTMSQRDTYISEGYWKGIKGS